jgi:hypothetical protein
MMLPATWKSTTFWRVKGSDVPEGNLQNRPVQATVSVEASRARKTWSTLPPSRFVNTATAPHAPPEQSTSVAQASPSLVPPSHTSVTPMSIGSAGTDCSVNGGAVGATTTAGWTPCVVATIACADNASLLRSSKPSPGSCGTVTVVPAPES